MGSFQRLASLVILAVLAASGCDRNDVASRDEQERADPAIQAAWAAGEAGDVAGAEVRYDAILKAHPDMARAHLDMAMVLMGAGEKPIKAIYHFMRYIDLRPETEKRDLIGQNIRVLTAMIGSKVSKSRIHQLETDLAAVQAENEALRRALGVQGMPLVTGLEPPIPAAVAVPVTGPRAYTVRPGDSLSRIAQAMYGDAAKARRIFEANEGRLRGRDTLQAGQVLVIPP